MLELFGISSKKDNFSNSLAGLMVLESSESTIKRQVSVLQRIHVSFPLPNVKLFCKFAKKLPVEG